MAAVLIAIFVLALIFGVLSTIATGNVGVRTTLGVISPEPVAPGVYFKWPFISSVDEFSAKEISIDLNDLKPKRKPTSRCARWTSGVLAHGRARRFPVCRPSTPTSRFDAVSKRKGCGWAGACRWATT